MLLRYEEGQAGILVLPDEESQRSQGIVSGLRGAEEGCSGIRSTEVLLVRLPPGDHPGGGGPHSAGRVCAHETHLGRGWNPKARINIDRRIETTSGSVFFSRTYLK